MRGWDGLWELEMETRLATGHYCNQQIDTVVGMYQSCRCRCWRWTMSYNCSFQSKCLASGIPPLKSIMRCNPPRWCVTSERFPLAIYSVDHQPCNPSKLSQQLDRFIEGLRTLTEHQYWRWSVAYLPSHKTDYDSHCCITCPSVWMLQLVINPSDGLILELKIIDAVDYPGDCSRALQKTWSWVSSVWYRNNDRRHPNRNGWAGASKRLRERPLEYRESVLSP